MRRRAAILRGAAAAAVLGAAGMAIAGPAGDERPPRPVVANLSAPLAHSNSRAGRAVLTASNMAPGDRRSGDVTIANRGHDGALYLVAGGVRDRGAPLSRRLELTIAEVAGPASRPVAAGRIAAGPLATIPRCHPLGRFAAGESRTYRFAIAFADGGGDGAADNLYAGAGTSVDFEWLETAAPRAGCPADSETEVDLPGPPAQNPRPADPPAPRAPADAAVVSPGQVTVTLGQTRLAIVPGPYRFAGRRGTAKVGIRCIDSPGGRCRGRLELERRRSGQGRGIAMAVGRFAIPRGSRRAVTLRLNQRARRRITRKRAVPVRALVTATDAGGATRRAAYRDRLVYSSRNR